HPAVRVPMREIELSATKTFDGREEKNEPVRVYDCSGPWGDPAFTGVVEEYDGREVKPQDNGYLSGKHAEFASQAERNRLVEFPGLKGNRRRPLRANAGHPVTQLWYARQGIVTPEMEFIAIRENMGRANLRLVIDDLRDDNRRNDLA